MRPFFLLPPLLCTQIAFAQPPDVPSTIRKPATERVTPAPAPIPDPPPITSEALQTLLGGPTIVTFGGVDLPAKTALQTLLETAGMKVSSFRSLPEGVKPLSVAWQNTPFWDAALDLEKHTGGYWDTRFSNGLSLTTQPFPNFPREILGISAGLGQPSLQGRGAAQTPFVRLIANSIARTATRGTRLGEIEGDVPNGGFEAPPDRIQLALTAFFDPKLRVRSVALRDVRFQAAPNVPLQPERPVLGALRFSSGRNANLVAPQTIAIPSTFAAGSQIARLSGILHSVVETQLETWNIADIGAAPKSARTIGGGEYSFEPLEPRENQLHFRLKQPGPRPEHAQIDSVRVRDAQGREVPVSSTRIEGQQADFTFRFTPETRGPFSLEWPIATQTRSYNVPFELRDLVVP